jgi:hypothetical protein
MKTLDEQAKQFAYNEKNETQKLLRYPDGLFNGFIAGVRSNFAERQKIKAQIELLEHLNLNWDLDGIHPGKEHYLVEMNWLKTQLKQFENE